MQLPSRLHHQLQKSFSRSILISKKRDASSPLHDSSLELKKTKVLESPLTGSESDQDFVNMSTKRGVPVLTERDLDNIVDKMQNVCPK